MDIHEFYDSTFDQFLKFMKPNELEGLIHDIGMRVLNNESILSDDDNRTNVMWTSNGNFISSYDINPFELTFPSSEDAEGFIDTLNRILDDHPGYITLNEFYEAYNDQITEISRCFVPSDGILVSRIITNPVDTVVGFLVDKDFRIDKVSPTKGITRGDPVIIERDDNQCQIQFVDPVDVSKSVVAYAHTANSEGKK